MRAELRPFRLPLVAPLHTGRGTVSHREGLLLSIGDGIHTGWGEATPMPGWSNHGIESATGALAAATAALGVIDDPDDLRVEELVDDLDEAPHARAALAGALADLRARRAGLPLAATLGDDPAPQVAVNALVSARAPDDVAAECAAAAADGITTVKLKVGAVDPGTDRMRIAAARAALGAAAVLRLDANGAWDVDTAVAVLHDAANHDIGWCEEPTEGIDAIAEVGRRSAVPVAVDESARNLDDVARALGTRAIDVIVVKPQGFGGPDLAVRAIRLAEQFGATAVVTTVIDGAIGVTHALHVAAVADGELAHGLATSTFLADDVASPPAVVAGRMTVPTGPGLGIVPRATLPT